MGNEFSYSGAYTDLMTERRSAAGACGVAYERLPSVCGVWERIRVMSEEGARKIGRPEGRYHTLTTEKINLIDSYGTEDIEEELANELWEMCDGLATVPRKILVAGLGNEELTPDALGPLAAKRVEATMHIKKADPDMFRALGCSEIAVVRPGVTAQSGIDAADTVLGVCARIIPDLIIAIDALCAESQERLGTTVQISDTGIFPGAGVGNPRLGISRSTVGCPVIAIGIPTVIDASVFSGGEKRERMLVTPREINAIVKRGADIIAGGINRAFGIVR